MAPNSRPVRQAERREREPAGSLRAFVDLAPAPADFLGEVLRGLASAPKTLPCKFFYDAEGSRLFERICELPEYYPTRTETAMLGAFGGEIAAALGPSVQLLEYGCGSTAKVRLLLDALERPAAYVGVDIARGQLLEATGQLAIDYPGIAVYALCADFANPFDLGALGPIPGARRVGFFPGSTIGNFHPSEALQFLAGVARTVGRGGMMLIGVDLKKDPAILHAAYNDGQGVTAAFNLNLLARIDRELGGDFDLEAFEHRALFAQDAGRIEMHLVSRIDQAVTVAGRRFRLARGETLHTENSYKYDVAQFQALARRAGWNAARAWVDERSLFSIHLLETA
jgi:dimethylhistidine N-methyltransferase